MNDDSAVLLVLPKRQATDGRWFRPVVYQYELTLHGGGWFTCTCFCEVGAPYQPLFADEIESRNIVSAVDFGDDIADAIQEKE